ncbi:SPFH domain-containing protein [Lentisphaerota bacterium WC36G]|nr:hypothetical protein LJT99_09485 [Lentisphaerae bacterium WC36]
MKKKLIIFGSVIAVFAIFVVACFTQLVGKNEVQNFQIIQSLSGNININAQGGYYTKFFATVWTYPKIRNVYFSRDKREGSPLDESIEVRFKNKGIGYISTRVTYRLYTTNETITIMHENCGGDIEIADSLVLSKIKEIARVRGSEMTSSEIIERQESYISALRKDILNNEELAKMGVAIEKIEVTSIDFDQDTIGLFKAQQKAILLGKEAEANKIKYDMQLKETDAKYKQQIAEEKGKAEMQKMKAVTDAEREAELAKIDAERKVTVAELEKKEALVKQQKILELAEIDKRTAMVNAARKEEVARIELEQAKLDAKAKIELALAKQKEIELSGAITEKDRVLAEIEANKQIRTAAEVASAIRGLTLPQTVIVSGGGTGATGSINSLSANNDLMKMFMLKLINDKPQKEVVETTKVKK